MRILMGINILLFSGALWAHNSGQSWFDEGGGEFALVISGVAAEKAYHRLELPEPLSSIKRDGRRYRRRLKTGNDYICWVEDYRLDNSDAWSTPEYRCRFVLEQDSGSLTGQIR